MDASSGFLSSLTTGRTRTELYRHPSDVARLVMALMVLGVLVLAARLRTSEISGIAIDFLTLVDGLPIALVNGLVGTVQLMTLVVPLVAVGVLLRSRGWILMMFLGLSALLAAGSMALLSGVVDRSVPVDDLLYERVDSWFIGGQYPSSTYLAALTACLVTASPWMTRSWRRSGWVFIGFVVVARTLSSTEVPVRNLMMLSVGAAAGSLALVLFGAPRRRVNIETVSAALGRAGIEVGRIAPASRTDVPTFSVDDTAGQHLFVKVVGRDQRDSNVLLRAWRSLTLKGVGGGVPASPRRSVDHEALALGIIGTVAPTPRPLAVLGTEDEAAVLVTTAAEGIELGELPDVSDATLHELWSHVVGMQARRLTHGALDTSNIVIRPADPAGPAGDGDAVGDRVMLIDLARADLNAGDVRLGADVAELLASLTLLVGVDRAVESARAELPADVLERAVSLLQKAVLSRRTRNGFKDDDELLDQLREQAAHAAGIDTVQLAPVRRLTVGGIVSLVGSLVLVAYVFNLAANWDQTWEVFTSADLVYMIPVAMMAFATYFTGALSLMGSVTIDLAYMRTVAVMFGQSYLNRFTPANAGGMAMRVRYLQLNGLDTAVSASAIALTSGASGIAQVVTILVFLVWGGASDRLSDFEFPDMGTIVIGILVIGVAVSVFLLTRFGRTVVRPWAESAYSKIMASIRDLLQRPAKLAQLFGGALLGKLANVIAFWASMLAFGVDISFPKAGAMYIIATTIGSAVPTPGGVGGVEAALTAALIAFGVDNASAAAIVLFFRMLTFWMPTIPGYGFFRYTQAKGIV